MIENLVFSGGGTKIYSFLGFLKYHNENNPDFLVNIKAVVGTSAGSFIALLICLDYSYNEIEKILINLKISKFKNIKAENVLSFFDNYGIDDGTYFIQIFKIIVKAKTGNENTTFKELFEYSNKKLVITAVCLNNFRCEYFSYDTHANMEIVDAIMMSGCVPFFFKPIVFQDKYYVDGALLNHYPICYFENELNKTYGVLVSDNLNESFEINNFKDYMFAVISCQFVNQIRECYDKYKQNTIIIELSDSFLDFDITIEKKQQLIDNSYKHTIAFFKNIDEKQNKKNNKLEQDTHFKTETSLAQDLDTDLKIVPKIEPSKDKDKDKDKDK